MPRPRRWKPSTDPGIDGTVRSTMARMSTWYRKSDERVFISYRRSDEIDAVRRMRDKLVGEFGKRVVFKDENSIHPGDDYAEVIRSTVSRCRVLLVVIGPGWLNAADDQPGPRLFREDDWPRQEVAAGLSSPHTTVIPLLLKGAPMPKAEQLPASIRALAERNYLIVSTEDIEENECAELAVAIEKRGVRRLEDAGRSRLLTVAVAVAAVVALAAFALTRLDGPDSSDRGTDALVAPAGGAPTAPEGPVDMIGDFNVAVANFTSAAPEDQVAAGRLARTLARDLEKQSKDAPEAGMEVQGPEKVGVLGGSTKDEREQAAKRLASRINADVVIGASVSLAGPSTIDPIVFLNPERLADNPELGGLYNFDPIKADGSYTGRVTRESLVSDLKNNTAALGDFLDGVNYYAAADEPEYAERARTSFTEALASQRLPKDAQEGAHAFLGSLSLLAGDNAGAAKEYEAARSVNPRSFRGRLGRAELRFLASAGQRCARATVNEAGLADAAAEFAAVGADDPDDLSGIKAALGRARAQRCQLQAGISVDGSGVEAALNAVIDRIEGLPEGVRRSVRELEAAAHAELALVVAPEVGRADPEGLLERSLEESAMAAGLSTRPKNQAIYLWQQAFYAAMSGDAAGATEALARAAEMDPSFADVRVDMFVPQGSARFVPSGVGAPTSVLPGGLLPQTGGSVRVPLGLGLVLLAVGALLSVAARRLDARGVAVPCSR